MRGRGIQVKIFLLHVLGVIALVAVQPEEAFLEDGVAAIPERQREAKAAFAVGDAEQAILAPAIGAAAGVVVRQVIPAIAVGRIILAHRAPLALGEVRAPAFPILFARRVLEQALGLRAVGRCDRLVSCGINAHAAVNEQKQ